MSNTSKLYRHFKGNRYKVLGTVKHSETLEEMVLYETLYENSLGKLWVRPKEMFFEEINRDGKAYKRFASVPIQQNQSTEFGDKEYAQIRPLIDKVFGAETPFDHEAFLHKVKLQRDFLLLTAEIEDQSVAFKLGYRLDHDTFYSWLGAVDPEHRDLGIAKELMEAQHLWCRDQGYKKVQTKTKNRWRAMLILDLQVGFNIIGSYTDDEGECKLILERTL